MSSVTRHLSPEELAGYRQRRLPPADLLRVDDHLAGCAACREGLADAGRLAAAVSALADEFDRTRASDEHPGIERLSAYVDDAIDDVERELIDAHLAACASCAEDAGDLLPLRRELGGAPAIGRTRPVRRWIGYVALAAAAGLAGFVVWATSRSPSALDPDARLTETASPSDTPPEAARISLDDGRAVVTLMPDGRLEGLPPMDGAHRDLVRAALDTARVPVPADVLALRQEAGTLMSSGDTTLTFQLRRPVATAVSSERPLLEWTALEGARTYEVSVFDPDFNMIARSGPVTGTRWQPSDPLPRGRTYLWQVRARGDRDTVAPAPPAPEVRFRVLSEEDAVRIAGIRQRYADSPLTLGVLLAHAGLLDEAERELASLAAANPDVAEVQHLLASLRDMRPGVSR